MVLKTQNPETLEKERFDFWFKNGKKKKAPQHEKK